MENKQEIDKYISSYRDNSIRIKYNGYKKSPGVVYDVNSKLVREICIRFRETNYNTPSELLRDIFVYCCEESAQIWACYRYLGEIGQALIEKSKTRFVLDYLHYSQCYFDSLLSSGNVKWEESLVIEMRDYLEELKLKEKDENILHDIEFGLKRRFGIHHIKDPKKIRYLSKPIKRRLRTLKKKK